MLSMLPQTVLIGTRLIVGITSRYILLFAGGWLGSRYAGELATLFSEGTMRPRLDATVCPCGPSAYWMKSHVASLLFDWAAMQYASLCSIVALVFTTGSGATSHVKFLMV